MPKFKGEREGINLLKKLIWYHLLHNITAPYSSISNDKREGEGGRDESAKRASERGFLRSEGAKELNFLPRSSCVLALSFSTLSLTFERQPRRLHVRLNILEKPLKCSREKTVSNKGLSVTGDNWIKLPRSITRSMHQVLELKMPSQYWGNRFKLKSCRSQSNSFALVTKSLLFHFMQNTCPIQKLCYDKNNLDFFDLNSHVAQSSAQLQILNLNRVARFTDNCSASIINYWNALDLKYRSVVRAFETDWRKLKSWSCQLHSDQANICSICGPGVAK